MLRSWTETQNQRDRDRRASQRAARIRARKMRQDNRRDMAAHPVAHAWGWMRGR